MEPKLQRDATQHQESQIRAALDKHGDKVVIGSKFLIKGEDTLRKLGKTPVGPSPNGENSRPASRGATHAPAPMAARIPTRAPILGITVRSLCKHDPLGWPARR